MVGDGTTLERGDTALIRYVNFRGDNGVTSRATGAPTRCQVPFEEGLLPGLLEGMDGMNVGGRRAVDHPAGGRLRPEGNPQGGLPADTDMIFVIELHRRLLTRRRLDQTTVAEVEPEVEHSRRVRQLADGDQVDTGLGHGPGRVERQPTARLEPHRRARARCAARPPRASDPA